MVAAVEFEIKRQIELYEAGKEDELRQETRGWNEAKRQTYLQRSKEDAHDYRYFPEPDLPKLHLGEERIKNLELSMIELPMEKVKRYISEMGIKEGDAKILVESRAMAEFFEKAVEYGKSVEVVAQQVANYIINNRMELVDADPKIIVDDIKAKKASVVDDQGQLEVWAKEVISESPGMVEQYKGGKETVIMALVGGVMRKSEGKANAMKVKEILEILLVN